MLLSITFDYSPSYRSPLPLSTKRRTYSHCKQRLTITREGFGKKIWGLKKTQPFSFLSLLVVTVTTFSIHLPSAQITSSSGKTPRIVRTIARRIAVPKSLSFLQEEAIQQQ